MRIEDLNQIRKLQKMSVEELAQKANLPKGTVEKVLFGVVKNPRIDTMRAIEKALGISEEDETINIPGIRTIKLKKIPMLGEIACGKPIYAKEEFETFIDASEDIKADFCLTARGDSMIDARIKDGDVVFIKEQPIVENGQIAAVLIGNDVTLKYWFYHPEESKLTLQAANPKYESLVFLGEELNQIRCLGLAVYFMSNL